MYSTISLDEPLEKRDVLSCIMLPTDKRELLTSLPEVRRLRSLVERNDWHHDDALQQSLRLFRWVKRLPDSLLETVNAPEALLQALLAAVVDPEHGHHTVQELLAFAALIHDVGKAETYRQQPDGTTRCPGHEVAGARLAPSLCARFGFSPAETDFITALVGAHGEPYELFKTLQGRPLQDWQGPMVRLAKRYGDRFLPLLLLAWGDLVTSHLAVNGPDKYKAVLAFYRTMLHRTVAPIAH